jgi:hypothetical protein
MLNKADLREVTFADLQALKDNQICFLAGGTVVSSSCGDIKRHFKRTLHVGSRTYRRRLRQKADLPDLFT